jgi:transposase
MERDTKRVQHARADYHALIQPLDLQRFKFVDESGGNLAMTRRFGRAPRGERVIGAVPQNYGANLTMIVALGLHGIEAVMMIEGATDAEVFAAYAEQVLGPTLRPGDIVVLDNVSAHQMATVREVIEGRGARLLYLSPYSPDLAPIEQAWSKIKIVLRTASIAGQRRASGAAESGSGADAVCRRLHALVQRTPWQGHGVSLQPHGSDASPRLWLLSAPHAPVWNTDTAPGVHASWGALRRRDGALAHFMQTSPMTRQLS